MHTMPESVSQKEGVEKGLDTCGWSGQQRERNATREEHLENGQWGVIPPARPMLETGPGPIEGIHVHGGSLCVSEAERRSPHPSGGLTQGAGGLRRLYPVMQIILFTLILKPQF